MFDNAKEPVDILGAVDPVVGKGGVPANLPTAPGAVPVTQASMSRRPPVLLFAIIGIVILLGGGVGIFYYLTKIKAPAAAKPPVTVPTNVPAANEAAPAPTPAAVLTTPEPVTPTPETTGAPTMASAPVAPPTSPSPNIPVPTMPTVGTPTPAGAANVDTDGDGLTDAEERTYGTDPTKIDTDGDGLTDREEIMIYKTDPLKADTDGDGYSDGAEVKGGYNPLGPGKMTALPTIPATN